MKSSLHPQPPSFKQKLPYLQFNNSKKNHNQSLKKIVFHQSHSQHSSLNNIGLLPRLQKKPKQYNQSDHKDSQTSLEKNQLKWNIPEWNSKKRQKLQTEGHTSQDMTEGQESFVSLNNKILHQENDNKDTMFDFRKKIQQNKLFIKKEIEKKNKQNHQLGNRQKSLMKKKRINSSRILDESPYFKLKSKHTIQTPNSQSKLQISLKQKSLSKKKKKVNQKKRRQKTLMQHSGQDSLKMLPKKHSQGLFTNLQVILDERTRPEQQKQIKEEKKLRVLLSKLQKIKKDNQYSSHSINQNPHAVSDHNLYFELSTDTLSQNSRVKLKRETNYHEWNKVNLSATSEISYRKSSFQEQLRKVAEYTDRNDASLEKYLVMRKELLKIGFQVQLGHCGPKKK